MHENRDSTSAADRRVSPDRCEDFSARLHALRDNLQRVIYGKGDAVELLVVALAAGGSVLMEDVPGVGKTTLSKALARSIDAEFRRVQFTPDLLPADILGSSIYSPVTGEFTFRAGPVFCNVLLADEINRASPRTQSALLEAMNERQASIEGVRRPLPEPFCVLATQNPVEYHGTYPLPEAQLDRFLIQMDLGYPDAEIERKILHDHGRRDPLEEIHPVLDGAAVRDLQHAVRCVEVDESVSAYIVEIVSRTRQDERVRLGVSPRGSMMLYRAAQAAAVFDGRDYVRPDDVQKLAPAVLAHRIMLTGQARYGGSRKRDVIEEILRAVKVPA
jgi:MoxR-like ATPase